LIHVNNNDADDGEDNNDADDDATDDDERLSVVAATRDADAGSREGRRLPPIYIQEQEGHAIGRGIFRERHRVRVGHPGEFLDNR
jgi:hypothetical protein